MSVTEHPHADLAGRWIRDERVLWREFLGRVLLLPPDCEEPLLLSAPGGLVWELLAEPRELDTVVATLADCYGEPVERVASDLDPVFAELVGRGAVRPAA